MRKIRFLFVVVCAVFLLSGCWDRTEVNDLAFVVATGVDKGKNRQYRFSVQIPLPSSLGGAGSSGGGGGTSGEGPFLVAQGTGGNLRQGIEDIQTRLSRKLYFSHRRVMIVGEDLAKVGIMETLNSVFIQPQSRLSTILVISKGDAVNMLQAQPRMEQFSGEAIREMAKAGINMTVMDAIQNIDRQGIDTIVPFIENTGTIKKEKDGKEINMSSFAVFKDDKLSFTTNKNESQGILWLLEKMKKKSFSFPVSKNKELTLQIINHQVHPNVNIVNGKPEFNLSIRATGTLLENEPNLRIEDPKTYHWVIGQMEKKIKSDIQTILKHSHSLGVDIFGFGWNLYKTHNQDWEDKWKKDWANTLPSLKVRINVDADIQRATNSGKIEKE
ncbi:Ger(x)C family spore germination protein [Neobacillus bataviensis]|uniref:Ger(x)C family spore germination protein n=1 Tax=Neobacillus bataviensis TaxID=220685 RepID=UPI001CBC137F|nr:Ger(x)C family spore germination protein [Neobacillus bataviensis]